MHNSIAPQAGRRAGVLVSALALAATGVALADAPAAHAVQVALTPSQIDTSATRANGHHEFLADGVRVWTTVGDAQAKAAGYFDVNLPLDDVGEPSMDWANNTPAQNYRPGLQLKTDFNGDGDIDGILVGEPIMADGTTFLGNRWWLAGGTDRKANVESPGVTLPVDGTQPSYRQNIATLDDWRAAFPDAEVVQAGWSLGSGALGDGVIYGITVGGTEHLFTGDEQTVTRTIYPSDVDLSQTRATGHHEFRLTSGVRVWTEGATSTDKAAGYFAVGMPFAEIGEPRMDWRANAGSTARPGLQLVVDIDGNDSPDGILVGEPIYQDIAVATNWWLSGGSATQAFKDLAPSDDGGNGSSWNGTLAEWRAALPATAQVLSSGWSLGSGVQGDGVIESITLGRTSYVFTGKNRVAESAFATVATTAGSTVSFTLPATDPDGDVLTYRVDRGTVADNKVTVQVPADFVGDLPVGYTADDGNGGISDGVVTLQVGKASSSATLRIKPAKVTAKQKVKVVVRIVSTGATTGGAVVVRSGGDVVGSGTVVGGKVKVKLDRKLAAGNRKLKVAYAGTAATLPVQAKVVVKVAR
ncbi:Ig-like domain-containing protein [Nocardioides sp. BYT-33-1]|uniref:Ig-like domain-containing protein n=1 Tax=Nocardioides sp. BYT-33-1 TaxID=3416952 RepID=UPI003F52B6B3